MSVLLSAVLMACGGNGISEPVSGVQSVPVIAEAPGETPTETQAEANEAKAEDVIIQVAGFWRLDYPNIVNATIMILYENGSWESPGFLPADHVYGGSFIIENEEAGIYQFKFKVEHSTDTNVEVGHSFNDYFYDAQNDLLYTVFSSGEGDRNVDFIREPDITSIDEYRLKVYYDSPAASAITTDEGMEYRFEKIGFAFTIPHSWGDMYIVDSDDDSGSVNVTFHAMDIYMDLFSISLYFDGARDIYDWEIIKTFNISGSEYMMVVNSWQRSAMREHDWIGDYRDTVETMFIETDTIVADSIRILED